MIKIRYADLPGGLHVRVVPRGQDTIIYLLPGLTIEQRRAALRRVRSSARMGHGPRLSSAGLAYALVADRATTTVRNAAAALRVHPAMFVPLIVILMSAAVGYFVLMSVSIRVHPPQATAPQTVLAPPIDAAARPHNNETPRSGRPSSPALRPGTPSPRHTGTPTPRPSRSSGGHPSPTPSPSPSPGPAPTGLGQPPYPQPLPVPSATPTPSPISTVGPSQGDRRLCIRVGSLEICL